MEDSSHSSSCIFPFHPFSPLLHFDFSLNNPMKNASNRPKPMDHSHPSSLKPSSVLRESFRPPSFPSPLALTSTLKHTPFLFPHPEAQPLATSKPVRSTLRPEAFPRATESRDASTKTMRPPCRQSENVFDLDEVQHHTKPIRIVRKQPRPPSRQQTPSKAGGLELPPTHGSFDMKAADMSPKSLTQPLSFVLAEESRQKARVKPRGESTKEKRAVLKTSQLEPYRARSAKHKAQPGPVVVTKRKLESSHVNSRDTPHSEAKRSVSRGKQQNQPIFSNLQPEFLDLFA
jgi:hypothetical protein